MACLKLAGTTPYVRLLFTNVNNLKSLFNNF